MQQKDFLDFQAVSVVVLKNIREKLCFSLFFTC